MNEYAVLIPTRNRPQKVIKLLKSLTVSTVKPKQIIIIASGEDIAVYLEQFDSILPLTYLHTETSGQINQKRLGIPLLISGVEWCLFMDDDLELHPKAIEIIFREVSRVELGNVAGIGFSLPVTSRSVNSSKTFLLLASLLGINTKSPGRVLKSGHATSYMQSEKTIQTEWLNGASMWRTELLSHYGQGLPSTTYAAYEDVIFSYPLRKNGILLYVPTAKMFFQDVEKTDFDDFNILRFASYWRYFFVNQNTELSSFRFATSEIGRTLFAFSNLRVKSLSVGLKFFNHILKLLLRVIFRVDPQKILSSM